MSQPLRVGVIGYGAITRALLPAIAPWPDRVQVVGVVRKTPGPGTTGTYPACDDIAALLALRPDLVVECAGHEALRTLGPLVLRAGVDLLVASVGALADPSVEAALQAAAVHAGRRVRLIAGAVGALDALGAARHAGLTEVHYTGRKPPAAWRGTAAEAALSAATASSGAIIVFEGNAREAALRFPQNANVAAAIALAGVGFEATRVQLLADSGIGGNVHQIMARGAFGRFDIELAGLALADNPRTSRLTVGSLARALLDPGAAITFA